MKTFKKLFYWILIPVIAMSCERDYNAPPIPRPEYTGEAANTTIAKIKEVFAATTADAPSKIEADFIIRAVVTGNDVSGNVYKQLYIEDSSGAINIGIDQNSMYTSLPIGQEVFIHLKGLSVVNYGGELQIGYEGTNANRIPWEIFEEHAFLNDWPNEANAEPTPVTIGTLTDNMVNRLIRLDNVYFVNGGVNAFTKDNATTSEPLKDGEGKTVDVRTSSYSNFAAQTLPSGSGTVIGLLGRFNGAWQLTLRSVDDVMNFGGELPKPPTPPGPGDGVVFMETFGSGTHGSGNRPKIADFTGFDMQAPVTYEDASGNSDIRSVSGDNGAHVWFKANGESYLTIKNINTSAYQSADLELSFELAANLYGATDATDLNVMSVTCNGTALTIPSTPVSKANGDDGKFYSFKFDNIPSATSVTLEFKTTNTNTLGLRLDNIKIASKSAGGGSITPTQP